MGIPYSCPGADFDQGFEAVIVRSFSFDGGDVRTALRSVSFNGRDSTPTALKSIGSRKMIFEGSVSLKGMEVETMVSIKSPSSDKESNVIVKSVNNKEIRNPFSRSDSHTENVSWSSDLDSAGTPKHEAALKLQKVYKSFRTRRKLADCAVLVEQGWWKLLDFAELKRSSVSFFDLENETAVSRWSRARTRAAKVGKGLSKDDKAQKLALQHWLEAIDPRHRYGHNLHFYYITWLRCESRQPFFYWLDVGEGRDVNLIDQCARSKLQQQCIKYLGPTERQNYEVIVENGKFSYKLSGNLLDTSGGPEDAKWIFVLSTTKTLYVGQKRKGTFQHSSFLAGGATSAAGRLVVEDGVLKAVWPHSGHYRPTEQNFQEFVSFLTEHNVDLTDVKKSPTDEDEEPTSIHGGNIGLRSNSSEEDFGLRSNSSEEDLTKDDEYAEESSSKHLNEERTDLGKQSSNTESQAKSKRTLRFVQKLTNLEIPKRNELFVRSESDGLSFRCNRFSMGSPLVGYKTAGEAFGGNEDEACVVPKRNLFETDEEADEEEPVPEESIILRLNMKKLLHSYQLGKQLSCKWTTGAGPRIGCVRDYPSELQFRCLEQVNLSPRSGGHCRAFSSPRKLTIGLSPKPSTPTSLLRETTATTTRTNFRS